ncbi:hypothetical protein LAV73_09620 [Lysinibacillus xylanilyticus]|uniref:hypothetical protein n=1 Tax=Lysinibacillus xylanilyticus TaxID=582475 RepID=UPI002B24FE36|nr:hypothetical protein [Lysinibacillus xylanilyticus]MEB2280252.1 hypothetical protein [Lysinibacillus xylanilyticus]
MEDSKLYSTQGIEQLKQKIEAYKDTLTSLKMGTSIEDYLFMKMDFDEIKTQIALLEEQNETIDDKQKNSQIRGYEEQIKLLSAQIESLNQTIEEMNRDILKVLNKLLTIENTEAPTTPPKTEKISNFIANGAQRDSIITQTTSPSANTSKQPSYKMLQNLAGKATNTQLDVNNGTPSTRNGNQKDVPEERHFNQQYFQSINTHPSQIYNGLYRNTNTESTFHFKHATNIQEIPVSINGPALAPDDASTPENYRKKNTAVTVAEMNAAITNEPSNLEVLETVIEPVIPEAAKNVNEPVVPAVAENVNEPVVPAVAENVNEPVVPAVAENINEPVVPAVAENVNEPVILAITENVNEPVIPKATENVNELVISEATEMVNEPVILETDRVVNEQVDAKSPILIGDESEILEPTLGEVYETHAQIEEVNESPEENQKKEKGSLFFNFFRKWS